MTEEREMTARKAETEHDFAPFFHRLLEGVRDFVRSEDFPETCEDSLERKEIYLFAMTEYFSWIAFTYEMAGMQWYTRYIFGKHRRERAEGILERYAGLQSEYTELLREFYREERYGEMLREDQTAAIWLVLSIRTAEKLWRQGLSRKERKTYEALGTLDHALAAYGETFRNTEQSYDFDLTGDKVMDTAMALCHFMIGEFHHNYIQDEYARIHGIEREGE